MGEGRDGLRMVARVLIMKEPDELLLCRSRDGKAWVPPGGTLERGESLTEAAVREAAEEVGLQVTLGPLAYVNEFRPKGRDEHVIEMAFRAAAQLDRPSDAEIASGRVAPAGPPEQPWRAWFIQDVDGPRRVVRWFARHELAAVPEPVYPPFLRDRLWTDVPTANLYLGLTRG